MGPALLLAAAAAGAGPIPVDDALLRGLPISEAVLTAHGKTHHCAGPTLAALLAKLGFPAGANLRGAALMSGVLVRARDGYAVLFSLGELDAALGNAQAIVATSCDGEPLDDKDGPLRLIVPGEARSARSVRQVETIEAVGMPGPPSAPHAH